VESVGAADDQLDFVVHCFGAGVAEFQVSGGEDAGAVFADRASEADEWLEAAAGEAGEEPVDQVCDGLDGEVGGEDRAGHLFQRPGAGGLPACGVERVERVGLAFGEVCGVLQQ
jgi:hypothetical protein